MTIQGVNCDNSGFFEEPVIQRLIFRDDGMDVETFRVLERVSLKLFQDGIILQDLDGMAAHVLYIPYFAEKAGHAFYGDLG